jgi:hypothetical protein
MALSHFQQLRGRIGASRLAFSILPKQSDLHHQSSLAQTNCILQMLKLAGKSILPAEKATLSELVATAGFLEAHACRIMKTMNTENLNLGGRRDCQDFETFPYYMSLRRWEVAKSGNLDQALLTTIQLVCKTLNGVNVSELTKKRMTAFILFCSQGDKCHTLPANVKDGVHAKMKLAYDRMRREYKKTNEHSLRHYIQCLPCDPIEYERLYSSESSISRPAEGWSDPQIAMTELEAMCMTLPCRGGNKFGGAMTPCMGGSDAMQLLQNMMLQFSGRGRCSSDDANIEFLQPKRRMLADAIDDEETKRNALRMKRRALTLQDWDGVLKDTKPDESSMIEDAPKIKPSRKPIDESSMIEAAPEESSILAEEPKPLAPPGVLAATTKTDNLLDAIIQRDVARNDQRAADKKAEKEKEKEEKQTKAAAENAIAGAKKSGATTTPTKANVKAAKPSPKTAAKTSPKTPVTPDASSKKRRCVDHEASRSQYLARSLHDGSKAFKYHKGGEYKSPGSAKKAAEHWLALH